MINQFKIVKNIGRDSHVRDVSDNIWQEQSTRTTETMIGEVDATHPEPLFRQTTVTVKLARGGAIKNVPYPGAFIDPMSGNLHGTYEGPIQGQMVAVAFAHGNMSAPYVVNRYPYQGVGNTFYEQQYVNPLANAGFHPSDVMIGHYSGSYFSFNTGILPSTETPGSIKLKAMTEFNAEIGSTMLLDAIVSAEMKAPQVKLTGTTLAEISANEVKMVGTTLAEMTANEINAESATGGIVNIQTLIKIKNASQSMKTLVDSLIDTIIGLSTTNCVVGAPVTLAPATIGLFNAEKAKWALLLDT